MTPREHWLVARSIVRVMRDSNRIEDIHRVAEITSRGRFGALLQQLRAAGSEPELLRRRPELDHERVDFETLRRLPPDTLGGAYVRHLDDNGLTLYTDPTSSEHVSDPDIRYLIHRYRQVHDIWHVLLGLGTQGHEEVLLHAFVLGHLQLPISALVVVLGSLKHIVLERRWHTLRHELRWAFHSGREAAPLMLVPWEQLWDEPLVEVRRRYRIHARGDEAPQW